MTAVIATFVDTVRSQFKNCFIAILTHNKEISVKIGKAGANYLLSMLQKGIEFGRRRRETLLSSFLCADRNKLNEC